VRGGRGAAPICASPELADIWLSIDLISRSTPWLQPLAIPVICSRLGRFSGEQVLFHDRRTASEHPQQRTARVHACENSASPWLWWRMELSPSPSRNHLLHKATDR